MLVIDGNIELFQDPERVPEFYVADLNSISKRFSSSQTQLDVKIFGC